MLRRLGFILRTDECNAQICIVEKVILMVLGRIKGKEAILRCRKASLKTVGIIPVRTDEGLSPVPMQSRDRGLRK